MKWEDYKAEFEFDGSLRGIYVLHASASDWQCLNNFFHSGAYKLCYTIDAEDATLPQHVSEIFAVRNEASTVLSVHVGSVLLCCHFFAEEEIEFDIDPRDIKSESEAEQLFGFMCQVSELLNKEVILTPENVQSSVIFRFSPNVGRIQYIQRDT